jgi:hypothetical protein
LFSFRLYFTAKTLFMSRLEELLDERYPESEISHIQRAAFAEGYVAAQKDCDQQMKDR